MVMNNRVVIVDSSALVALLKVDDIDNGKALGLQLDMEAAEYSVLIPMEVLAETLNVIGKKFGRDEAVAAGHTILEEDRNGRMTLVGSEVVAIELALDLQSTASGGPSFVDCLVMAHATQQQTPYIFGFDLTFKKNGYRLSGN